METLAGPGFCSGSTGYDPAASAVRALGVDAQGTVYVDVGLAGQVRKADNVGTVLVPTGLPVRPAGARGDSGQIPAAGRLAPDGKGGFYLSAGAKIIRLDAPRTAAPNVGINPGSISLETFAGDPSAAPGRPGTASTGDGGPFNSARFTGVLSIASDERGGLYIADRVELEGESEGESFRVRYINAGTEPRTFYASTPDRLTVEPGTIGSIAGVPGEGNSGDGGPAVRATLAGEPPSLGVRGDRLYLGLSSRRAADRTVTTSVRMINLGAEPQRAHGRTVGPGAVETVAGGLPSGFGGDGETALRGRFSQLPGIAADDEGALYLADRLNHRIRKVDSGGLLSTLAGTGSKRGGYNGHGLQANRALLNRPFDVKVGAQGEVLFSDEGNGLVRVVDQTGTIQPGPGNSLSWKCAGGAEAAAGQAPRQANLSGVAVTPDGSVLFSDSGGNRILGFARPGLVEPAQKGENPSDKPAFDSPAAISAGPRGGLLFLSSRLGGLWFFNRSAEALKVAGTQVPPGEVRRVAKAAPPGSTEPSAGIPPAGMESSGVTADTKGNVYLVQGNISGITRVASDGKISGLPMSLSSDPLQGCCARPAGVASDFAGNLYVSDAGASRIWFINLGRSPVRIQGRTVGPGSSESIAGNGTSAISGEGVKADTASIQRPGPLTVDRRGNVYFVEGGTHAVRRVDAAGVLTTVIGAGNPGFNGDGLNGKLTLLNDPSALAADRCGNLLVADRANDRVRRLNLSPDCEPAAAPKPAEGAGGESATSAALAFGALGILALAGLGYAARRRSRSRKV